VDSDNPTGFHKRRRHLPQWHERGATYFVTFTLRRPLPIDLTRPDIGSMVLSALLEGDGTRYLLYDHTIMPDHVHLILKPLIEDGRVPALSLVMGKLKGSLSREINRALGRQGPLWQDESYTRIIRNEAEYHEKARYIYHNPVRRDLIADPAEWPWWGMGSGGGL